MTQEVFGCQCELEAVTEVVVNWWSCAGSSLVRFYWVTDTFKQLRFLHFINVMNIKHLKKTCYKSLNKLWNLSYLGFEIVENTGNKNAGPYAWNSWNILINWWDDWYFVFLRISIDVEIDVADERTDQKTHTFLWKFKKKGSKSNLLYFKTNTRL